MVRVLRCGGCSHQIPRLSYVRKNIFFFTCDLLLVLSKPLALLGTCPRSQGINPSFSLIRSLHFVAVDPSSTPSPPLSFTTHVPSRSTTGNRYYRNLKTSAAECPLSRMPFCTNRAGHDLPSCGPFSYVLHAVILD